MSFATVNRWEGSVTTPQRAARTAIAALAAEEGVDADETANSEAESAARVTRRRSRRGQASVPDTKPMEQMLWDAACSIRGEKDAAKFKDYLLPLLFLKRLSDVFDDEIDRLAQEFGDRTVAQEIAESDHELLRFYLPPEARWGIVSGREVHEWLLDAQGRNTRPRDVGEHLTRAVRAVRSLQPDPLRCHRPSRFRLRAQRRARFQPGPPRPPSSRPSPILAIALAWPMCSPTSWAAPTSTFSASSPRDPGRARASSSPHRGRLPHGPYHAPQARRDMSRLRLRIGGLLIKLQLVARETDPTSKVPLRLYGQELQADSYAVAHMNAIIHDMDVRIERGDTMINPKFKDAAGRISGHDIVVANPMWNQDFNQDTFEKDPFDRFRASGGVTTGKGDWAWLQHTLACLNERGRAAVVLDTGAVTRGSGSKNEDRERNIRRWFRGAGPNRRRGVAAGQPLLQHQRRRHHRRIVEAQAGGAEGQDRAGQRQPSRRQGPPQELSPGG